MNRQGFIFYGTSIACGAGAYFLAGMPGVVCLMIGLLLGGLRLSSY